MCDSIIREINHDLLSEERVLSYLKGLANVQDRKVKNLEVKGLKRVLHLIQKKIAFDEKEIERITLQENFPRMDLKLVNGVHINARLLLNEDGYLIYITPSSSFMTSGLNVYNDFDIDNELFTDAIDRKKVMFLLEDILKQMS